MPTIPPFMFMEHALKHAVTYMILFYTSNRTIMYDYIYIFT